MNRKEFKPIKKSYFLVYDLEAAEETILSVGRIVSGQIFEIAEDFMEREICIIRETGEAGFPSYTVRLKKKIKNIPKVSTLSLDTVKIQDREIPYPELAKILLSLK